MRKIGDDAEEDSPGQPDNHGNNSQECNTCQIKGFVRKQKERESPYLAVPMGESVVDCGKAEAKREKKGSWRENGYEYLAADALTFLYIYIYVTRSIDLNSLDPINCFKRY